MNEAPSAPNPSQLLPRAPIRRRNQLSPLEALERGFALFRSTFSREAWRYYVGSAPFVLCFIPIWVANGQIRVSDGSLFMEAVLLASAYLLRVWMVSSYLRHVRERAFGTPSPIPTGAMARVAAVARLVAWKIVLSTGTLVTLPTLATASWLYSASQFASLEAREDGSERHSMSGCLGLSTQWFGGSLLFFLLLFPLWTAVWMNGVILSVVLPQLLHAIFGVNTLLSSEMGMYALIRSSAFWLAMFMGAWFALDPVVKCTFVVVYQHLRSRREGDDLRGLLASLPRENEKKSRMITSATVRMAVTGAVVTLFLVLSRFPLYASAQTTPASVLPAAAGVPSDPAREARVQTLRTALDRESQRAVYRWHDAEHPSSPTWFDKLLERIGHQIARAWNFLENLLGRLWPRGLNLPSGSGKGGGWHLKDLRLWVTLVALLTLAAGAVLFWLRRRREPAVVSVPLEIASLPDLSDSAVASERSEDEWFSMANLLEGQGEFRLAVRAAYFGLLAGLAQRNWLTIRRDRTNREYLSEFTRRWHRRPQAAVEVRAEMPERLRGSLRQFDRAWYGLHPVTPDAVTTYRQNQQEFLNHV